MKLTLGYILIDCIGKGDNITKLTYNGQVCVDGIETFIVKKTLAEPFKTFCYGKREHVFEKVMDMYGDTLEETIDNLAKNKSVEIKAAKKSLALSRKLDRESAKKKKPTK